MSLLSLLFISMDFEFKKSLGQNFLKDNNIIEEIVNSVDYKENIEPFLCILGSNRFL